MNLRAALLGLAVLLAATASAGAACPAADSALHELKSARAALLAIPTGDGMQTDVSKAAWARIAHARVVEATVVRAIAACHPDDVKALSADLAKASIRGADNDSRYGSLLAFEVTAVRPGLIVVAATTAIECGADTMLMVFERAPGGWREAIRFQSPSYKEISGGITMLNFKISPPDARGRWFFAESNILPWCSSTWSGIHYTVLRPSGDPLKPVTVVEASDEIWWGSDDYGRLSVGASDVTLRFHAASIDGGVHNREYVRHFAIDGNTVRRVPPLANSARDFAEEWIQSDWTAIAPWTVKPDLKPLHDAMHKDPFYDYVYVRRCAGGLTDIGISKGDAALSYALLVGRGPDFKLLDVATAPHRACTGPNQFKG